MRSPCRPWPLRPSATALAKGGWRAGGWTRGVRRACRLAPAGTLCSAFTTRGGAEAAGQLAQGPPSVRAHRRPKPRPLGSQSDGLHPGKPPHRRSRRRPDQRPAPPLPAALPPKTQPVEPRPSTHLPHSVYTRALHRSRGGLPMPRNVAFPWPARCRGWTRSGTSFQPRCCAGSWGKRPKAPVLEDVRMSLVRVASGRSVAAGWRSSSGWITGLRCNRRPLWVECDWAGTARHPPHRWDRGSASGKANRRRTSSGDWMSYRANAATAALPGHVGQANAPSGEHESRMDAKHAPPRQEAPGPGGASTACTDAPWRFNRSRQFGNP